MPWERTCPMEERMKFVIECMRGELGMAEVCRSFGISRKTGYKWLHRYRREGPETLSERSARG